MDTNLGQKQKMLLAVTAVLFVAMLGISWLFHGTGVVHAAQQHAARRS